jgi:hypothetical protein
MAARKLETRRLLITRGITSPGRAWHVTLLSMQTSPLTDAEQESPIIISDKPSHVFLVIDDRFGVVSASLDEEEAMTDLRERVLAQMQQETLVNPGSFRLKSMRLRAPRESPADTTESPSS